MDNKNKAKEKLKQIKYQHLKKKYAQNLAKLPHNCKYNKEIILPNKSKINICGFDFEDNREIDLCYKPEHSKDCNAFCSRKNKEELYLEFVEEIKDDQVRATKYKDINIIYFLFPELQDTDFYEKKSVWSRIKRFIVSLF